MSGGRGAARRRRTAPCSGSARVVLLEVRPALADPRLLLVLDDGLLDVEPALGDALHVGELDLLGALVEIGVVLDRARPACRTSFWASFIAFSASSSAFLVSSSSSSKNCLVWSSSRLERVVLGPLLAEADERIVAGQHVDAVEHEGDVIEVEVHLLVVAQLEELLADHVEVGDGDHVEVRAAWLLRPSSPRPSSRPRPARPRPGRPVMRAARV